MSRCRVLFTIVCSLFLQTSVWSQSVDQLISFADEKYQQGQFELAAKEYQRALFFGPKEDVGILSVATGDCYFQLKEFQKAEKYYRFASTLSNIDSLKTDVLLKKASCLLLSHRYQLALFDLFSIPPNVPQSLLKKKNVLSGIAYFGLHDFEKAESYFAQAIPPEDSLRQDELKSLFDSKKLNRPNPKLAYWMSVVIPGSGQFYVGDFKNGLNSMILSVGLAILTYEMAINQSIVDALLTVFPWWQRYYIGGYNSAEKIAERKKQENRTKIYKLIYSTVMD